MRFRSALVLLLLSVAGSSIAQEAPWSLVHLDVEIDLDPANGRTRVRGRETLRLTGSVPDAGPVVGVNSEEALMRFLSIEAIDPPAPLAPIEPRLLGETATEIAAVRFDTPLPPGSELTLQFELVSSGRASQFMVDSGFALGSWVEAWYPVPGTVDGGFGSSAAPGTTIVRMPAGWRSVAPGALISSSESDGTRIETWRTEVPMARSFVAGPLTRVEVESSGGADVSFFVLDPSRAYTARAAVLGRAIEAMEERFGPYPYASWNVVEIPEDRIEFAAAAEQGFVMVRSSVLANESGALPLFAHEAGHAWWGNRMRGDGPGSRMIGEALAQYGAVIAIEALEGREAAVEFLRFSREGYNPLQCALGYFFIAREGDDEPLAILEGKRAHNLADSKGMWFHHMTRERLGDDRFFAALRALFERFDGRAATLGDLRSALLASAPGDAGLARFLEQWLDRTGAPEIEVRWWSIDRGKGVEITLEQTQPGPPFDLDLDLEIELHDGTRVVERVSTSEREKMFRIAIPSRALQIRVDPLHRVLLWRPEYGPPLSRAPS